MTGPGDIVAIVGALAGCGFGVVAVAVALRNGALRELAAVLEHERDAAIGAAEQLRAELEVERAATRDILARRRREIERLYDELGAGDDTELGDRARRGLRRLLSSDGADR